MRTKKIYNWITLPTIFTGILLNGIQGFVKGGASGAAWTIAWAVVGCVLAVVITAGPSCLKRKEFLHKGDVKIWGAIGACLLPVKMVICWFYFSLIFGVISASLIAKAIPSDGIKGFGPTLKTFFRACAGRSSNGAAPHVDVVRKAFIPLCPAIAIGTYLGVFFDKQLMQLIGLHWY
jgi:prepilin signal peptidase PulO-like enzyme (type II secretory pathway)